MKSFLKWGAIIIGCLVVVIIAAVVLIPMFVDVQKYKPILESKVADATGRPFSVGDDLSLSLFPWAGVSFSEQRLGNPEDGTVVAISENGDPIFSPPIDPISSPWTSPSAPVPTSSATRICCHSEAGPLPTLLGLTCFITLRALATCLPRSRAY